MMHGPPALIEARDLERRTPDGRDWLLRNVSLSIQGGERLAIIGATGSGKTLLMRRSGAARSSRWRRDPLARQTGRSVRDSALSQPSHLSSSATGTLRRYGRGMPASAVLTSHSSRLNLQARPGCGVISDVGQKWRLPFQGMPRSIRRGTAIDGPRVRLADRSGCLAPGRTDSRVGRDGGRSRRKARHPVGY